jgi:hypothetical protein
MVQHVLDPPTAVTVIQSKRPSEEKLLSWI